MSILDRALRMGEGKQFRQYAKRVDQINAWEPELELMDDDELREQFASLRERARDGEALDDLLPETFAIVREASRRTLRHAPLRRADDRRHGPALRRDRRDAHRRGQDADRDARGRPQRPARRGRPPRHGQRLPGPPRRRVDGPDLRVPRAHDRRAAEHAALRGEARRLRGRHHLRHELRVRLRLPARQHGHVAGGEGPARRPHRRGRQARSRCTTTRSSTRSTTSSSTRRARR